MIVTIDVGNTNTKLGLFEGRELVRRLEVPSSKDSDIEDHWWRIEENLPEGGTFPEGVPSTVKGVVICSVVPALAPVFSRLSVEKLGRQPILFDWSSPIGLVNRYRPPKDVGADRLANAFAAWKICGAPAIIVDIGTAVTLDVVTEQGEYLGGIIAPGVNMAAEALSEKTALLPRVTIQPVANVLGNDTVSAIRSGVTHGYAAMIGGLAEKLKDELGLPGGTKVILTGGHVNIFRDLLAGLVTIVDADLTLKGLNLIYWELSANADGK